MRPHHIRGTWAVLFIALLGLSAVLLGWGFKRLYDRTMENGRRSLERALDTQLVKVTALLNNLEHILDAEAAYVENFAELSDRELLDRWRPILLSYPGLRTIGLADENGNQRNLSLTDKGWTFVSTRRGSPDAPPNIITWSLKHGKDTVHTQATHPEDPRESVWFSQALEERHGDPVWSTGPRGNRRYSDLNVSLLIRAKRTDGPYRILRITIDPAVIMRSAQYTGAGYATIQMTPDGDTYDPLGNDEGSLVWRMVLDSWTRNRFRSPFRVTVNGNPYLAQVIPRTLKGADVFSAAVVDLSPLDREQRSDRTMLWLGSIAIAAMGIALFNFQRQALRESHVAKLQEKRSLTRDRQLAKALGERDILDREVHHRVKNNLQVVSSLLNLQLQRIDAGPARDEFLRGKRRIDAMAMVHHKLYALNDLRAVELSVFLSELAKGVSALYDPRSRTVSYSVETRGIQVDTDTAIPLGMILCELVGNSFQHAFPFATGGHIDIGVRMAPQDGYIMSVVDNGRGMGDPKHEPSTSLGLEIVEALADQLDGRMRVLNVQGTGVEVSFRARAVQ